MNTYEFLFFALHALIAPAWLLLFLAPRARPTTKLVHSGLYPMLLGIIYGGFLVAGLFFGQSASGAGMNNLAAITALLSHPNGALTGWVHFLVFDLFVASWIARDANRSGLSHLSTVPALLVSLIFGPLGLLLYLVQRGIATDRGFSLGE